MSISEENEEKKRYLNGYRYAKRREAQLVQQIEELRSQKMNPSIQYDGMPKGNAHSDLSGYVARLDILISQLEQDREATVKAYHEIHDQIHKMQDGVEKEVLERRYLLLETWDKIAICMNYTYRHVIRLHGLALQNFTLLESCPSMS